MDLQNRSDTLSQPIQRCQYTLMPLVEESLVVRRQVDILNEIFLIFTIQFLFLHKTLTKVQI